MVTMRLFHIIYFLPIKYNLQEVLLRVLLAMYVFIITSLTRWSFLSCYLLAYIIVLFQRNDSSWIIIKIFMSSMVYCLTHRGRVTHICVGNLTIIGSDNGLSPGRCQAIIRTNAWILLIGPLGTNFSEILAGNQNFRSEKYTWKCRLRYSVHFVLASMS